MKKILITNDDGILADGLIRLASAAKKFGEVCVIAPYGQRSAGSHSITLHDTIDMLPFTFPVEGVTAYASSGTPADCIRASCLGFLPERPDVVLTGINFGHNVATDIQYSATAGAALEGAFHGCLSIALSEGTNGCHEVTDAFLEPVLRELLETKPEDNSIFNVNFPDCPLSRCRGILRDRHVSADIVYIDRYPVQQELPGGGVRLSVEGIFHDIVPEPGSDFEAIRNNYISIGSVANLHSRIRTPG